MTTIQWVGVGMLVVGLWLGLAGMIHSAIASAQAKLNTQTPDAKTDPRQPGPEIPTALAEAEAFGHLAALKNYFLERGNRQALEIVRSLLAQLWSDGTPAKTP